MPATVRPAELAGLCEKLGNAGRSDSIRANDPGGSTIHNAMQANGLTSGMPQYDRSDSMFGHSRI